VEAAAVSVPRADRLYRAIPLASAFLWLCILYGWQTRAHVTPWLFTDELKLTQISRSISETGHAAQRGHPSSFQTLYAYVIAPFWRIHDVGTAYAAIKYAGVVVMTSAMFPAFFLARMIVSRPWALFAAVGAVATPALAYAPFLVEEPAAYPWATLCLFLIVKALATRSLRWVIGAAAATIVAPLVRGQLAVLIPVYALAALFLLWTGEPAKRWRRTWSSWDWVGAVVLGIGAIILFSAVVGAKSQTWYIATGFYRHRTIVYGLWAAGAFAIGVGLLPVVALAALVRPRGEAWTRELKAFVAVTAASVIAFGLYTATKASYLSTQFATVVAERNLIYLAPLAFVATALALERRRLRWWAVAATGGFVLYLILTTPYQLDLWPYSDALGFSIVQMANRDLAFDDRDVTWLLVAALVVSIALLLAPLVVKRRRISFSIVAVAAALVLAWNLSGEISASNGTNVFSRTLLANFADPPDWLDRATHGRPAIYLGQRIPASANGVWLMEFWNRSLRYVWSLDGTAPGPGTYPPGFVTPDAGPDGRLTGRSIPTGAPAGVDYIVADAGIQVVGTLLVQPVIRHVITEDQFGFPIHEVVVQPAPWRLLQIDEPLRLQSTPVGIEPDGWTTPPPGAPPGAPAFSAYNQFSTPGDRPGFIRVVVSGQARPQDKPGKVTITAGPLIRGKDKQPALGRVTTVRRWVVRGGTTRVFFVPASPPTRVEVRVSPTFSPHDFGGSDLRRLGAQVSYSFSATRQ
jgi:hypothetical protein